MKIELSEKQQQLALAIISNAQIQGKDAPAIMDLAKAIQTPIPEKPNDKK